LLKQRLYVCFLNSAKKLDIKEIVGLAQLAANSHHVRVLKVVVPQLSILNTIINLKVVETDGNPFNKFHSYASIIS